METGQPQASIAKNIVEGILSFLPEWLQIPIVCLIILLVVLGWVSSLRKKAARRRAARNPQPVPPAYTNQGSGAAHLGPYAPAQQAPRQPSGADHLGSYAPQQRRDGD
ncbi:hypothetical protein [Streptomyces kurssanovii]|uniref:Uncharacterized protein n=1 Tax=Streptomyces kurssanovii TaxID=67312 RepID=A0ABV3HUZ2_9ACTN